MTKFAATVLAVVWLALSGGAGSALAKPSAPVNVSPPTVTGLAQVGETLEASTGNWSGSTPMSFSYQWLRCDDSGSNCVGVTGAISSSYTLTSADASTSARVVVTAKNKRGQASATSAATSQVAAAPPAVDTTAPTAPSSLSVSNVTETSLTLSWAAASDNVAVAGYRVYRDGTLATTTTSLSFGHSSLTCGTSYTLGVEAFDAAGNTSTRTAASGATVACSSGGKAPSGLRVQGNKIVDGSGNVVVLHGVNRSGTEYACQDNWGFSDGSIQDAALQKIADWKTSSVRVLLNERCWNVDLADNQWDGATYRKEMVAYVDRLVNKGLVPIVSLMWSAPGSGKAYNAPMPNRDNSPRFWTSVANTFKGNSSVIFDLLNEPHPDGNTNTPEAWRCWKNGGTCAGFSFEAAGMQELVDAIRAAGATNIISIPGVQYANNLTGWLANKPHDPLGTLVASWHIYEFNLCNNLTCYENQVAPVIAQVPVIANEIGAECNPGTSWASTLIKWLDSKNTGYNAWTWNVWGDCNHSLITDYDTGAATPWGSWYRDHLATLPPAVQGPDATAPIVTADPKGGVFGAGQNVVLSANEPATIYYTLDGSTPTKSSPVYRDPLTLNTSTKVSFMGVDAAGNQSAASSETYTIDTSLPAMTIEAETMKLAGGYGGPVANSSASGGHVLYVWNTDTGTIQVTTPSARRMVVRAYGASCEGAPNMVVKVDGVVALDVNVTSSTLADHQASFPISSGAHTITVSYTNEYASSACNRNLWVDKIDLYN